MPFETINAKVRTVMAVARQCAGKIYNTTGHIEDTFEESDQRQKKFDAFLKKLDDKANPKIGK